MIDFVLRHGNDLLSLESLKGYEVWYLWMWSLTLLLLPTQGSLTEQGRVLRVGIVTVIDGFSKHRRKAFLFERCLLLAKIKQKGSKTGITGTEEYHFRNFYRVCLYCDMGLCLLRYFYSI